MFGSLHHMTEIACMWPKRIGQALRAQLRLDHWYKGVSAAIKSYRYRFDGHQQYWLAAHEAQRLSWHGSNEM